MFQFDTTALPAHERFDAWEATVQQHLYGLSFDVTRERRERFAGRVSIAPVGGATYVRIEADTSVVRRTLRDIARSAGESIVVCRQGVGLQWWEMGSSGQVIECREGAITMGHSDAPFSTWSMPGGRHDVSMFLIPQAAVEPLLPSRNQLPAPRMLPRRGAGALLGACYDAFVGELDRLSPFERDTALQTLLQLGALAYAGAAPPAGREAVRAARLALLRRYIDGHFRRADLTPAQAARACAVSLRQLHLLFQRAGTTFASELGRRRLACAHDLLIARPALAVTEVALCSGYASLATFYRAFEAAYATTPTRLRRERS